MGDNRDANDDFVQFGSASVRAALDAARWPGPPTPPISCYEDDYAAQIGGQDAPQASPAPVKASSFVWRSESDIPPRKWLYGRHLLRKFISVDVAAGGVGKSSVKIGEALAMASNQPLYGKEIGEGPLTVWLYNLEDPMEETERRLHATAKRFSITPDDVAGRLYVDSGRDQPCVVAEETINGTRIIRPVVDSIIEELTSKQIDVLILDPFVSSHALSENDNRAMDMVVKEWARIADACNCSINLVHHVRKANGTETSTDSARGAKSITDAARSVVVYNRMTKDEAEAAGIPPNEAVFHFRTQNDKANLAPADKADWFRMNNVDLDNGDKVGVACPWSWPDLFSGISLDKTRQVQKAVSGGKYQLDIRSRKQWVGNIISGILGMDPADDKKRLQSIIKEWIKNDVLRTYTDLNDHREERQFVEVGKWVDE